MQVIARGPLRKVKLPLTCLVDVSEVKISLWDWWQDLSFDRRRAASDMMQIAYASHHTSSRGRNKEPH